MMEQHFTAFIDLLGFSEMVSRDCRDPSKSYSSLTNLIDVLASIELLIKHEKNVHFIQFSDSILLTAPFNKSYFSQFLLLCQNLQITLLQKNMLCRGGIAVGRHYFQDNFVFSEGLIEAYRLESIAA